MVVPLKRTQCHDTSLVFTFLDQIVGGSVAIEKLSLALLFVDSLLLIALGVCSLLIGWGGSGSRRIGAGGKRRTCANRKSEQRSGEKTDPVKTSSHGIPRICTHPTARDRRSGIMTIATRKHKNARFNFSVDFRRL